MVLLSILKTYNPSIDVGEAGVAEFDAEIDMSLLTRVKTTTYAVETGQEVSGSLVLVPAEIRFTWAVGLRQITPLLSTEAVDALTTEAAGLVGGFVSNFIDSGIGNFVIATLANSALYQNDEQSRAFLAMSTLQKAQITGLALNITIEGVGTMRNMLVSEIRLSRSGKDGGKVTFNIYLSQRMTPATKDQDDQLIQNKQIGEVKGEVVE